MGENNEIVLQGIAISTGIAIGMPLFVSEFALKVVERDLQFGEVDKEIERYRRAIENSRLDLEQLKGAFQEKEEVNSIFDTHLEMLKDPLLVGAVEDKIRSLKKNSETAVNFIVEECKSKIKARGNSFFRERVKDINDVYSRVLQHLSSKTDQEEQEKKVNILLASEVMPSYLVNNSKIDGIVSEKEGDFSHSSIIARAKGIPYVTQIKTEILRDKAQTIIVDGINGRVVVNPLPETLQYYLKRQKELIKQKAKLRNKNTPSLTKDGTAIVIAANVDGLEDVEELSQQGLCSVGLFRSEYIVLKEKNVPSEEMQFLYYKAMLERLHGNALTIRLFDIGADKEALFLGINKGKDLTTGFRAVRLLLARKSMLHTQLRAILRATVYGTINILVPFVADLEELLAVKSELQHLFKTLKKECKGIKMPKVGSMIEVPSAAIMCDVFAKESDFLSIGTNDLFQYLTANDRNSVDLKDIYHPALIRILKHIVECTRKAGKPLTLCGEVASNPKFIPFLLGLGIHSFSLAVPRISMIKEVIKGIDVKEAKKIVQKALRTNTKQDLRSLSGLF